MNKKVNPLMLATELKNTFNYRMRPEKSLNSWRGRRASKKLWQEGTLFHNFLRFPARLNAESPEDYLLVDRLLGILNKGLMAPAHCEDGSVVSEFNITDSSSRIAYDSLIFLHRYNKEESFMYTLLGGGSGDDEKVILMVDDQTPVMTRDEMGNPWTILSAPDEVYATEPIAPAEFKALYMPRRYLQEVAVQAALEPHDIPVFTY